jgi:hypothetical protein
VRPVHASARPRRRRRFLLLFRARSSTGTAWPSRARGPGCSSPFGSCGD